MLAHAHHALQYTCIMPQVNLLSNTSQKFRNLGKDHKFSPCHQDSSPPPPFKLGRQILPCHQDSPILASKFGQDLGLVNLAVPDEKCKAKTVKENCFWKSPEVPSIVEKCLAEQKKMLSIAEKCLEEPKHLSA